MRTKAAIGLALVLSACVSTGVKVTEEQASSFVVGKATYADVVAKLGEPTTSTVSSTGDRTAVYAYAAMQARPENFIPYIGGLVAGADTRSSNVTFNFDKRGILLSYTSSQNQAGAGQNLAAGAPIKRSAPQQ